MLVKKCLLLFLSSYLLVLVVSLAQRSEGRRLNIPETHKDRKVLRYFRNQTLRVICPHSKSSVSFRCDDITENSTKLGGYNGGRLDALFEAMGWKIKVSSCPPAKGVVDVNGNYSGFFGFFQRNESDLYPLQFDRALEEGLPVYYGPTVGGSSHKILSTYKLIVKPQDFLNSLDVFSLNTWILILCTMFTASSALKLCTGSNIFTAIWTIFRFIPQQALFAARTLQQKVLLSTFSLGSYVIFVGYFCNLLSTEKVTIDLSVLVNNLEDVLRLNKSPMFLSEDPLLPLYSNAEKGSVYEKIWDKVEPRQEELLLYKEISKSLISVKDLSIISYPTLLLIFSTILSKYSSLKQWISREEIHSSLLYLYQRPNMSREAVEALDDLCYRLMESHFLSHISELTVQDLKELMDSEDDALRNSLAEVLEDVPRYGVIEPVTVQQLKQLFLIYILTLVFGASSLLLEIVTYRFSQNRERKIMRERRLHPTLKQMLRITGLFSLIMAGNEDPKVMIHENTFKMVSTKKIFARHVWKHERLSKWRQGWETIKRLKLKRKTRVHTINQSDGMF